MLDPSLSRKGDLGSCRPPNWLGANVLAGDGGKTRQREEDGQWVWIEPDRLDNPYPVGWLDYREINPAFS